MNKLERLAMKLAVDFEVDFAHDLDDYDSSSIVWTHHMDRIWTCNKSFYIKNQKLFIPAETKFKYVVGDTDEEDVCLLI